jgi:hypothetical protein
MAAIMLHRLIMDAPQGLVVDHINGLGLDNRRANLRICTQNDNAKNQVVHRINRLGRIGVTQHRGGRFVARIVHNGITYRLGYYATPEEASAARRAAEIVLNRRDAA